LLSILISLLSIDWKLIAQTLAIGTKVEVTEADVGIFYIKAANLLVAALS